MDGPLGLHGDVGRITEGLLGGDRVAGGDSAPVGIIPTGLQCSSGFICHVLGTASVYD